LTPFIPPNSDWNADGYPYYAFPLVGIAILVLGGVYWVVWTKVLPKLGGYVLVAENVVDEYGEEVVRYRKSRKAVLDGATEEPLLGGEEAVRQRHGYQSIS
jgi:hypothetical protein